MRFTTKLRGLLCATLVLFAADELQAQQYQKKPVTRTPAQAQQQLKQKINEWTVGLAGGLLEGAPIRLATEMARVVNDNENLHVLPIVTRGPTENLNDLLYLKGVDMAMISSDSLDEYKEQVPDIRQRLTYILNLFPSEVHVFVRPEINSLADLKGKKVNFNTRGTAAAFTGPLLFSRLGIDIEKTFIPHPLAMEQMKKGENGMAAVFFITSKPIDPFLKGKWGEGFKFLPVEYSAKFEDAYLPSALDSSDYPNLIPKGTQIETLAAPTLLASYNWPVNSDRYRRVARFVDYLFGRVDKLQAAGFDSKWKEINLNAKVPGLERFRPAQEWLTANTARVGMRP